MKEASDGDPARREHASAGREVFQILQRIGGVKRVEAFPRLLIGSTLIRKNCKSGHQVILKILTDTGKILQNLDADRFELLLWSDSREEEDVWRADGSGGQDHLLLRAQRQSLAET